MNPAHLSREIWSIVASANGKAINVDDLARRFNVSRDRILVELKWLVNQGHIRSYRIAEPAEPTASVEIRSPIRLFISHSSRDEELAQLLVELFVAALKLPADEIRCSSIAGYRLRGGADIHQQVRLEVLSADAFVGIVSSSSLQSLYVLFELGARWGSRKDLVPVLGPGVPSRVMGGPLAALNALRTDSQSDLHQLVREVGQTLSIEREAPEAYLAALSRVLTLPVSPAAHRSRAGSERFR